MNGDPAFRCSVAGLDRGDAIAGTASTVRSFLLVENPGPWGVDAVRDSRLPPAVKEGLGAAAARARVRPLLIRRYHRRAPRRGFRVYAARTGLDAGVDVSWLQTAVLDSPEDLLDLDLEALGAGRSPGLVPTDETLAARLHPRQARRLLRGAGPADRGDALGGVPRRDLGGLPHRRRPVRRQRARAALRAVPRSARSRVGRGGGGGRARRAPAARCAARPLLPADARPGRRDRAVPPPRGDRHGGRPRAPVSDATAS